MRSLLQIQLFILAAFFFLTNTTIYAQNPGGVGNNLELWLKAGTGNLLTDQSGNGRNIINNGGAMNPVANGLNFNTVVNTTNLDREVYTTAPFIGQSIFVVGKVNGGINHLDGYVGFDGDKGIRMGGGNDFLGDNNADDWANGGTMEINGTVATGPVNQWHVLSAYKTTPHNDSFFIGGYVATREMSSSFAEIIVYSDIPSAANKDKIESYLALKYGITLAHDYIDGANTVVWDRTINAGYNNDIAGIGSDQSSGLNQPRSKSINNDALVTVQGTISASTSETLIWGNNNQSSSNFTDFKDNTSFFRSGQRMQRIWKTQKEGNPTNLTVSIPNTTTFPSNGKKVLIVSNSATFNNNVTVYPLTSSGGNYTASGVTLGNGQFFTFGVLDVNIWVKADAGVTGTAVSAWNDQSGSQNNLTQATAAERPDFVAAGAAFNFNPHIQFNQGGGTGESLGKGNFEGFGTDGSSHFMIMRRPATGGAPTSECVFSYAHSSNFNEYALFDPTNLVYNIQEGNLANGQVTGQNYAQNKPKLMSALRRSDNTNNNLEVYNDGTLGFGPGTYEKNKDIRAGGTLVLGQEQDALGGGFVTVQEFEGDMAEMIIYDRVISAADRVKVESYLAIKYGITLGHDYTASNNLALWTLGGGFDNDIAGVGRDNDFDLLQLKSKSVNAGSTVTMEVASLTNLEYTIWGNNAANYDNFTTAQAPAGMKKSDRIWKVSNPNNNYTGTVDITLVLPPSLLATPVSAIQLLVNNSANFATGTVNIYSGTKTANTITFTGVSLTDADFFTLGLAETLVYINNDPGAPDSWEACAGSDVSFFYREFPTGHPDEIIIRDKSGNPLSITALTLNGQTTSGGLYNGEVNFIIPNNAGTGSVQFLNSGTVLFSPSNLLVVHNPILDFMSSKVPVCADDTILLVGYPSGGTFSSTVPNLIVNDSIVGIQAGFNNTTNSIVVAPLVTYTYTPQYIDGTPCLNSVAYTDSIGVRDNRIISLAYQYVITPNNNLTIADRFLLTESQIEDIQPAFPLTKPFSVEFSGTFVQNVAGNYEFLTNLAGFGNHPVTLSYNNGGCIGQATADLDIFPPLRIPGLSDRLCREALPDTFTRDPLPEYRDTMYVTNYYYPCVNVVRTTHKNNLVSVQTQNPANQIAISTVSSTPNQERYTFNPFVLAPTVNMVIVEMYYELTTDYSYSYYCDGTTNTYTYTSTIIARDTVYLEDRPTVTIDPTLDTVYCENSSLDTLSSFPYFDQKPFTSYAVYEIFGNKRDTFLTDSVLDPNYLYNKHVPLQNRDAIYELYYIVNRYGCYDVDTARFTIPVPEKPLFFGRHLATKTYCLNETEDLLTAVPSPNSGMNGAGGLFLPAPGIGVDNQGNPQPFFPTIFAPKAAGAGNHAITYQFTDIYGCVSQKTDTLKVRPEPKVQLATANNSNEFCVNDSNVVLKVIPLSGGQADSIKYFGAGVLDTIFNPSAVFGGGAGSSQITVLFIDSFACQGRDTLDIIIRDIPNPYITGLNMNPSPGVDSRYCNNDTVVTLNLFPPITSGMGGVITGSGIIMQDTNAFYNPDWFTLNQDITSNIKYTYTDQYGCSDTYTHVVRIDSIPDVAVLFLDTSYCINDTISTLAGLPNVASSFGTGVFGGPGINPNSGNFAPSIAGTGEKVISYTFIDGRQCENTATDTTHVYGLPIADFVGLNLEYCIDAPLDTVVGLNLGGTGYFTGGAIVDPILGYLLPSNDSVGLRTITYVFTDTFGCTNTSAQNYYIHASPDISMSGLDSAYCYNGAEDIISVLPSGGTFDTSATSQGFSITGGSIRFEPDRGIIGVNNLRYIYRDIRGCSDTITASTQVFSVPTPIVSGLANRYCETQDTITINSVPSGGIFDGPGILNNTNLFTAYRSGSGIHSITYTVEDTFYISTDTLMCSSDTTLSVRVNPLPVPKIYAPSNNSSFCGTDTARYYFNRDTVGTVDYIFEGTGVEIQRIVDSTLIGGVLYYYYDTIYYFNPSTAILGTNTISYKVQNTWGCEDSIQYTYLVNETFLAQVNIDSSYCESEPPINLPSNLAGIPIVFINNNDTLAVNQYVPNPGYPTNLLVGNKVDTLISLVNNAGCIGRDTQFIEVNTVPQFTFVGSHPNNSYCLNNAPEQLIPSLLGGQFFGNGVLFGTTEFRPDIAGVGVHAVGYTYTDNTTFCSNTFIDTFRVYSNPTVDYAVVGGCENTAVTFLPDNNSLGLNGVFQNSLMDSITTLRWIFGDGDTVFVNSSNSPNQIDSILHTYSTAGTYMTSLYVENQHYCADSQEVRLVISPKVLSYPYSQDFETDAGDWFAEDISGQPSLLWEWGASTNNSGINTAGDFVWMTNLDSSYTPNQNTWVYSPCFDLSSLNRPMIKLNYWSDTDPNTDGTVIEYESATGEWLPLGEVGKGINWFNSPVIIGQPGAQTLAPKGWSGQTGAWRDARYKLDAYKAINNFRIRVAFGSANISQTNYYDGFAFDDVWIGNRSRNVLLEHFANSNFAGMQTINQHVYNLIHHSSINRDVNLMQYQTVFPAMDEFYDAADDDSDARTLYYGLSSTARAIIDGKSNGNLSPLSIQLNQDHFEVDMLEDPSFGISIDTFLAIGNDINLAITVEAKMDLSPDKYIVYAAITEDSLIYNGTNNQVHAVVRDILPNSAGKVYNQSWTAGDQVHLNYQWNFGSLNYDPNHLQVIVFVQNDNNSEIYQSESSRDVSGYNIISVKKHPEILEELEELVNLNLYPNPSSNYFNIEFEQPTSTDYDWKLMDVRGVEVLKGMTTEGTEHFSVQHELPTGMYIFVMYSDGAFTQRKVIIEGN